MWPEYAIKTISRAKVVEYDYERNVRHVRVTTADAATWHVRFAQPLGLETVNASSGRAGDRRALARLPPGRGSPPVELSLARRRARACAYDRVSRRLGSFTCMVGVCAVSESY